MDYAKFEPELQWEVGQLVYPEHFASLTNFLLYHVHNQRILPSPWGIYRLEAKIVGDVLKLPDFQVIMPQGLSLSPQNSTLEETVQLPPPAASAKDELIIYLACAGDFSTEYRGNLGYRRWKLRLLEKERVQVLDALPIARLVKHEEATGNWVWQKDEHFLPPLFKVTRDSYLYTMLRNITDKIRVSIKNFPDTESTESYLKFQTLYSSLAEVLVYQTANWEFPPYLLYASWVRILGLLKGVLGIPTERKFDVPSYDHMNLSDTFVPLYQEIEKCLETIVLSRYIERRFEKYQVRNEKRFRVKLPAAVYDYYILAVSATKGQQWMSSATIAYEEEIENYLKSRASRFKVEDAENPHITNYRPGSLYRLRLEPVKNDGAAEKALVVAGHTADFPERLVLLYAADSGEKK